MPGTHIAHVCLCVRQDVARLTRQLNSSLNRAAMEMRKMPAGVKMKEHLKYTGIMGGLMKTFEKIFRSSQPPPHAKGSGAKGGGGWAKTGDIAKVSQELTNLFSRPRSPHGGRST